MLVTKIKFSLHVWDVVNIFVMSVSDKNGPKMMCDCMMNQKWCSHIGLIEKKIFIYEILISLEGCSIIKINRNNCLSVCDFCFGTLRRIFQWIWIGSDGISMGSKCKWVQKQGFEVRCSCLEYFIDVSFSVFTFKIILHFKFWFL